RQQEVELLLRDRVLVALEDRDGVDQANRCEVGDALHEEPDVEKASLVTVEEDEDRSPDPQITPPGRRPRRGASRSRRRRSGSRSRPGNPRALRGSSQPGPPEVAREPPQAAFLR